MELRLHYKNREHIAEVISDTVVIHSLQDALDIMGNCFGNGASSVILHESHLSSEFFDLKTRLAGEILQKFSTYSMRLVIVGDFQKYESKSLRDFIRESNRYGHVRFVSSVHEVLL